MINIYKLPKKNFIPPPGEPREQKVRATQNFIKDEMTARVDIYSRIFEANFIWLLSSKILPISINLTDIQCIYKLDFGR